MKLDALDHPKTFDLAARLEVELPTVIGHLELLWAFTGKQASQGNIGKWPNGAIARACCWMGDPDTFVDALVNSKFVDKCKVSRLVVHDWSEHAPGWVRAKLKKLNLHFIESLEQSLEPSSEASLEPSTKCSEVKCSEGEPLADKSAPKRRSRIPADFYPNETGIAKAEEARLSVAVELEKFRTFHEGKGTAMLNWQAAWRTWILNAIEFREKSYANHRNTNADTIAAFTGQRQPAVPEGGSGFVVEGCGTRV